MRTFIIKQLIQAAGVCLVISMISFFLLFLNTDPALLLLPPEAEVQERSSRWPMGRRRQPT